MLFDYSFDEYLKNFKNKISVCRIAFILLFIITILVSVFGFIYFSLKSAVMLLVVCFGLTFFPYLFCDFYLYLFKSRYIYYYLNEDGTFSRIRIVPLGTNIDSTFNRVMFFLTMNEKFLKQDYKVFKSFAIDLMKSKELSPEYVKEKYMDVEKLRSMAKTKVEVFAHITSIEHYDRFIRVHYFNSRDDYFTEDIVKAYDNFDEMIECLENMI